MTIVRIVAIFLLASLSMAQQPSTKDTAPTSIPEPGLPVVGFSRFAPEYTGAKWVPVRSTLYDSWRTNRKVKGKIDEGEDVKDVTTLCNTRKPDRLIVKKPIPSFGLATGDSILRYLRTDDDHYDIWAHQGWYRDTKWTKAENGGEVLCTPKEANRDYCSKYPHPNVTLVESGFREYWIQATKSDGTSGWVFDASASTVHTVGRKAQTPTVAMPAPKLPVIMHDACPGNNGTVPNWKIRGSDQIYSSYLEERAVVGTLNAGDRVTILSGVNVVREPAQAVMREPIEGVLRRGDAVLGYGYSAGGYMNFWSNGVWFADYYEKLTYKGGMCGFVSNPSECDINVRTDGNIEWWVQVKTSKGLVGWVRASVSTNRVGNFGDLCRLD